MLNVLKLGHAEFKVRDLDRMAEFYKNVIGLTETGREKDTVYLSTSIDHHSIVLRAGADKTHLSKIAFQIAPAHRKDLTAYLRSHGLDTEIRTGSQPGINEVLRTQNPDGVAIEMYSASPLLNWPVRFMSWRPGRWWRSSQAFPIPGLRVRRVSSYRTESFPKASSSWSTNTPNGPASIPPGVQNQFRALRSTRDTTAISKRFDFPRLNANEVIATGTLICNNQTTKDVRLAN